MVAIGKVSDIFITSSGASLDHVCALPLPPAAGMDAHPGVMLFPPALVLVEVSGLLELQSPLARPSPGSCKEQGCAVVAQSRRSCKVKVLATRGPPRCTLTVGDP